ncbi:hypothetical protein [Zobellia galactanivorans]|uniref:hypothetical protein n=1 Tax=Zobellia galactanivorans (strain DSM 12802 / CCUG 47099 / CIP 106680 / NCIMB 13871 / Dsij) TaxID=63186 RepID=UPI001C06C29D|nr:hypothetical protein [Zobellia galactanivorans]MBU3024090.1 hypothetical protein [Zobellia galactanivorans]
MALQIHHLGSDYELDLFSFEKSTNSILASCSNLPIDHEFRLRISMDFDEVVPNFKNINKSEEEAHIFKNQHFSQNRIIELRTTEREGDGKIGYFFSKNSLFDSDENRFKDDKFLTTAAFRACVALIKGEVCCKPRIPQFDDLIDHDISQFYEDFDVILVLSNLFTSSLKSFDFRKQYLSNIRNYGFNYISNSNQISDENSSSIIKRRFESLEKNADEIYRLKTKPISLSIQNDSYLTSLMIDLLSINSYHPLTKFHLLYQVIEVLIDLVLKKEIEVQVLNKLTEFSSYKLKTKLNEISSEAKRIDILINNYSTISPEVRDLMVLKIKDFVRIFDIEEDIEELDLEALIYKLRNGLVHNYRATYNDTLSISNNESDWKKLMDLFEILIVDVISSYKDK